MHGMGCPFKHKESAEKTKRVSPATVPFKAKMGHPFQIVVLLTIGGQLIIASSSGTVQLIKSLRYTDSLIHTHIYYIYIYLDWSLG